MKVVHGWASWHGAVNDGEGHRELGVRVRRYKLLRGRKVRNGVTREKLVREGGGTLQQEGMDIANLRAKREGTGVEGTGFAATVRGW